MAKAQVNWYPSPVPAVVLEEVGSIERGGEWNYFIQILSEWQHISFSVVQTDIYYARTIMKILQNPK